MATTCQDLIKELVRRMGYPDNGSFGRTDVLKQLNAAYMDLTQDFSYSFLSITTTLTLNNATSSVAAPGSPLIDLGKTIILTDPSTSRPLKYLPPDEFELKPPSVYGAFATARPHYFTVKRWMISQAGTQRWRA